MATHKLPLASIQKFVRKPIGTVYSWSIVKRWVTSHKEEQAQKSHGKPALRSITIARYPA